ncbi:MAG: serine/threonine protein kinase [Deltaproteobacteria bacterium]|nr:serine/threonine protein kinase [Deltaproteobacteria bacterium]
MDSAHLDTPPATPSPVSTEVGQVIADRYRLVRKLGEGAMGAVFLAEHIHMRKRFALKLLLPAAMASPEIVARFEREAIAAGNIDHPGVCAATDFGRLPDGSFFLVLEYIDGKSLRAVLEESPLPPDRALGVARQILAALAAAHGKGVVHRDIKPENVMIVTGPNGEDVVKVLDFGIAKVDAAHLGGLGEGRGENLTRMGAIYGTPAYMSPEQAMGKTVDHRADLYAVGVMLHEMITGEPPFEGDGIVILARHVNDPPPPLVSPVDSSSVSAEVAACVGRLLAKKPDDRPESASQAIAEIDLARTSLGAFPASTLPSGMQRGAVQAQAATVAGSAGAALGGSLAGASLRTGAGTRSATHAGAMAATLVGEPTPAPPPVAGAPNPALRQVQKVVTAAKATRDKLEERLAPLARRAGFAPRHLLIVIAGVTAMCLLLLVVVLSRGPKVDDDETDRRPRRRPSPTASANSKDEPLAPPEEQSGKPGASPSSSAASKGGGGGGVKGIGRKIKSLF